jgi:hypothetical protein
MGNIKPLTGSSGEIRKNCRKPNWSSYELINLWTGRCLPNSIVSLVCNCK